MPPGLLHKLFDNLQERLKAELRGARQAFEHPGAKGGASEQGWRRMLAEYLPRRYSVSKAFVIDSREQVSDEIDLVIYDRQYSPFLLTQGESVYIPAESVYAVLEVKQELTRESLLYAGAKAASVRALHRTNRSIVDARGEVAARDAKSPFRIPAGLVCLESTWSPPFGDSLLRGLEEVGEAGRLDLLCALCHGGVEVGWNGGTPVLETSTAEIALIFFFLRLVGRLQNLGTVPAIDLAEYEKALTGGGALAL